MERVGVLKSGSPDEVESPLRRNLSTFMCGKC